MATQSAGGAEGCSKIFQQVSDYANWGYEKVKDGAKQGYETARGGVNKGYEHVKKLSSYTWEKISAHTNSAYEKILPYIQDLRQWYTQNRTVFWQSFTVGAVTATSLVLLGYLFCSEDVPPNPNQPPTQDPANRV